MTQRYWFALYYVGIACLLPPGARAETKLPFTIGKETTGIVSPLTGDGMVDYVAAVNAGRSAGVTPENNGMVEWLGIVGTEHAISRKLREPTLKMLGAKESEGAWEHSYLYFHEVEGLEEKDVIKEEDHLAEASGYLWKERDLPLVAEYLKAVGPSLDQAQRAVAKEKWWYPTVALQRPAFLADIMTPPQLSDFHFAWAARATLRAGAGDYAGADADLTATLRLARKVQGDSSYSYFLSARMEATGCDAIGAIAGTGQLTPQQVRELRKAVAELAAPTDFVDALDHFERWSILDVVENFSLGHADDKVWADLGWYLPSYASLDAQAMDWDVALRHIHLLFDQELAIAREENVSDKLTALHDFDGRVRAFAKHGRLLHDTPQQMPGETDAAYTDRLRLPQKPRFAPRGVDESRENYSIRVGETFAGLLWPNIGDCSSAIEKCRMKVELTQLILALATYKADMGQWPKTLDELVPAYIPQVPIDRFAPGSAPVNYVATDAGVRVYSVGPDGIDDGGFFESRGRTDDIVVGVRVAAP